MAQYIPKLWDKVLKIYPEWRDVMQTTFYATEGKFLIVCICDNINVVIKAPPGVQDHCLKTPDLTTLEFFFLM